MHLRGISWNAVQLADANAMRKLRELLENVFGLSPLHADDGFTMYPLPRGGLLELFTPDRAPTYGLNPKGAAFGFEVDDLAQASAELADAGYTVLGEVTRLNAGYAYRHFCGPDGRVYGLNQDPHLLTASPGVTSPVNPDKHE